MRSQVTAARLLASRAGDNYIGGLEGQREQLELKGIIKHPLADKREQLSQLMVFRLEPYCYLLIAFVYL